jgi:diguanylate cyclase (GGDEF)-like protein
MEPIKNSVLIVDDEVMNIKSLTLILSDSYTVYAEKKGGNTVEMAKKLKPDLILLDIVMSDMDGFQVIQNLKENEETKNIPVIFITGLQATESELKGFELGAVDYIHKPFVAPIVQARVQSQLKIVNLLNKVQSLIVTDVLTELGNRRYFNIELAREWDRAKRKQHSLSFILMDVDNFKTFNDLHGHLSGDMVLQYVSGVIRQTITRASDKAARWGGEEFAAILPDTNLDGAKKIAEDMRFTIANNAILLEDKSTATITVSVGVHCIVPEQESDYALVNFVADADKAKYREKNKEKNTVCVVGEGE